MGVGIWDLIRNLGRWLLDLLVWLFEWLYGLASECLQWLYDRSVDLVLALLATVAEYVPDGLVDTVTAVFEWLVYINEWVPIKYGIGLLVAYYALYAVLIVYRFFKSLIF